MGEIMVKPNIDYVSFTALVISIIALIVAFNTAATSKIVIEQEKQSTTSLSETNFSSVSQEVKQKLEDLAENIDQSSSFTQEEIGQQVAQIRTDIKTEYVQLEKGTSSELQDIDSELERIENNFRQGADNAIESLQKYLEQLQDDVSN